ncbi:MAG TPA: hypothetical protein VFN91_08360 [Myxococcaceae bacterium]|nr:hypothetical protein [Myxococcaceae bacterium]
MRAAFVLLFTAACAPPELSSHDCGNTQGFEISSTEGTSCGVLRYKDLGTFYDECTGLRCEGDDEGRNWDCRPEAPVEIAALVLPPPT